MSIRHFTSPSKPFIAVCTLSCLYAVAREVAKYEAKQIECTSDGANMLDNTREIIQLWPVVAIKMYPISCLIPGHTFRGALWV